MIKYCKKYCLVIAITAMVMMQSCQKPGGNSTGSEFMPDMGHSIAYEANYYNYYYNNTWGSEEDYYDFAKPKLPVEGTVPRKSSSMIAIPSAPMTQEYYYENTEEGRALAMEEIVDNPYDITDEGLARAKELYNVYCGICHGDKGDGLGYLARDDGAYPVAPAILISEEFIAASNGRFYHSIMQGRNLMGSYKDKLNYEERWQVIHYIRSLQAKATKTEYNQLVNTLNEIDRPAGPDVVVEEAHDHDSDEHDDEAHDHDAEGEHVHDDDSDHSH